MKKLFTFSFLMISMVTVKAQSGTVLLGGDVSYSSTKGPSFGGDYKSNNVSFDPYVGYQFNDNWTAGIVAGILNAKQEQNGNNQKQSSFNAGPFLRYTQNLSDIFSLYGQLEGRFGSVKTKNNGTTIGESNNTAVNLYPAAFINLKNNFGLNFNFGGLSYSGTKPKGGDATNTFSINFGKVATIGISKNFGTKKK